MKYKVKNISDQPYNFEGISLQPGEVSGELLLDVYQKLLALNYGTTLMPVEDEEVLTGEPTAVQEAIVEEIKEAFVEPEIDPTTAEDTQTVEVEVPAAAVAAEPVVEAPKRRGRPRKNL